jgi:hypothetical protein
MRTLPQVEWIQCSPKVNGDLWAAASDGRIEHLEPLARPTMVEESAAKPASAAKAAAPAPTPAPAGQQTPTGDEQPPAADSGMGATAQPLNPRLR